MASSRSTGRARYTWRFKPWSRLWWWALENRLKGYKWGPVQRFRCCDHTTPYHYQRCENHPRMVLDVSGDDA